MSAPTFSYRRAFDRNLGWITPAEQEALRIKRIAIAGLGGVGGAHLLTLTRLGIGAFNIADFDRFELHNFNRQVGANLASIGRPKLDVMAEMATSINPELAIRRFDVGVNASNAEQFLDGVDLYVDGLDFFVLEERRRLFDLCAKRQIPAITAAPLGMGAALLVFLPGRMSFEDYFRLAGAGEAEKAARFLVGLSPSMLQLGYLVDPSRVDLAAHKGPSTPMACDMCAGIAATEAMKILLGRGRVVAAPSGLHFDAYKGRLRRTWRPWGNANPLQRALISIVRRRLSTELARSGDGGGTGSEGVADEEGVNGVEGMEGVAPVGGVTGRILDLARWAPSGDNTQPWRFEIVSDRHVVVHAFDTRRSCVYDLDGKASQLAVGGMLETMRIAASAHRRSIRVERRPDAPEEMPVFDVFFADDGHLPVDALHSAIIARSVQRQALSTRPLTAEAKHRLEAAVAPSYSIVWFEGWRERLRMAWLAVRSAKIRLTTPEAFAVHRSIIDWNVKFSADRVPDQALGADTATLRLMRWAMTDWKRVNLMNRYFGGTIAPRVQLDLLPGLRCAAHFALVAPRPPRGIDDHVASGEAVQRFWLTATSLGLQVQPQYTPLAFADYARRGVAFTGVKPALERAHEIVRRLAGLLGSPRDEATVFLGRIGSGPRAVSRSLRLPLDRLLWNPGIHACRDS